MNFLAKHSAQLNGEVICPGDKSISQRVVMIASFLDADINITGFLNGNDPISTANALNQIGAGINIDATNVSITRREGALISSLNTIDLGNSGTGIRLLMGFISGLGIEATLTGDESLIKRPMKRVSIPLSEMGALITTSASGTPPINVMTGSLIDNFEYDMPISSAQVKSAILLAGLTANKKVTVVEKKITRDHTERMINFFGGNVEVISEGEGRRITLHPTKLTSKDHYKVAGDFSSASFLIVAGLIAKNSEILIKNVGLNQTRSGLLSVLKKMGANIQILNLKTECNEDVGDLLVKSSALHGIEIGGAIIPNIIDEIPILSIAASCAEGKTTIKDAKELRVKESDRLEAIASGLEVLNVSHYLYEDGIEISGVKEIVPSDQPIDSFDDHRIAMSFLISSLASSKDIKVMNCENIYTSFPSFFDEMKKIGLNMERYG